VRGYIQNHHVSLGRAAQPAGDKGLLAVQGKFQAIAAHGDGESLQRLLRGDVNDGYRPVLRIGAQICLPSGERSNLRSRGRWNVVIRHVFRGEPGGGLGGGAAPAGAPGGGPKLGMGASTCSMMLMVPEFTLEVKTVLSFGER